MDAACPKGKGEMDDGRSPKRNVNGSDEVQIRESGERETTEIKAGGLYHCLGGVSRIYFNFVSVRSSDRFRVNSLSITPRTTNQELFNLQLTGNLKEFGGIFFPLPRC